jgi:hypothetical protein
MKEINCLYHIFTPNTFRRIWINNERIIILSVWKDKLKNLLSYSFFNIFISINDYSFVKILTNEKTNSENFKIES